MQLDIKVLEFNGYSKLQISLLDVTEQDQQELDAWYKEIEEKIYPTLPDLAEEICGSQSSPFNNGWFYGEGSDTTPIGLTEAPFISEDNPFDKNGDFIFDGRGWYWESYQVCNVVKYLIKHHIAKFDELLDK